jgi:serine/threonine-protein kinase
MAPDTASEVKFEIGHVLFIDIVGYSQLLITQQSQQLDILKRIVRGTEQFRAAEADGKLLRLPTGDGGALVFRTTPEAPVLCALEIAREMKNHPELRVRMGIHSGPVNEITDLNEQANIAGAGINMAQRVMDCGDNGHILLSKRVADDLAQYPRWRSFLHDLGGCEVKHGVRIDVVNFYGDGIGNPQPPKRFQILQKHRGPIGWIAIAAAVLLAALVAFQFARTRKPATAELPKQTEPTAPATTDKSVAVLPFENLSSDKENAFFAQGIQDEIITTLSRISGLRVISRTSTARYSSAPENLPEIAKQLRVTNVLEGSVQKAGDRVHINVQLIRAEDDAHLWAQSYDRQLTDIFAVEAEVAKKIADSLQATLSAKEKASVETKPTTNADAYVLYLRARDYQTRPDNLLQDFKSAINLYEQAIKLDPTFALAHARLSATISNVYHFYEPTDPWKQKAHAEALESLRLQPNLGEGHLALGLYHYYMESDYDAALRELALAAEALPNDGDVGLYSAAVLRRRGDLAQALSAYKRAEQIDPRNSITLYDASQTYFALRDWRTAAERMDRVLVLFPDSFNVKIQRAYVEFYWKGSTAPIKAALQSLPPNLDPDGVVTFARWDVSLMDRDTDAAAKALADCPLETITSQTGVALPKSYLQGCVSLVRGDTAKAQTEFEAARPAIEKLVVDSPHDGTRRAQLGLLYAFLGRKEDALREGKRAMELKPITHDVIEGAVIEAFYAMICAQVGMADEAINRIERLLTTPFAVEYDDASITLSDLRTRWEWDPLRSDPRFQRILASPEPKAIYK